MTETHDLRNQWYDEPVKYETPMTKNQEEIEKTKAEIKMLQSKLSFLEELEQTKSPVEEAYKNWWGEYPKTVTASNTDDARWFGFQAGYNAAYEEKVATAPEEEPVSLYRRFVNEGAYGDDFTEDNRYVPINSKQYRAVRKFHEEFGTWMLYGLKFLSKEDFFTECAYFIPPVMMKLSNKSCFKEFHTQVHYNFS